MPQNIQPEVFIKMVLSNWELQNTRMNNLLENLTDEQLASETAPGRNTGMYLLEYEMKEESLIISGTLSLSELFYEKIIETDDNSPTIKLLYTIKNISNDVRHFLWKLHAALQIKEGDQLMTTAKKAKVVDSEYSRFASFDEFVWPMIEGVNASIIPSKNNTMDFFICMVRQLVKWNYYLRMNHLFFDTAMIKIFFLINGILLLMENSLIITLLFWNLAQQAHKCE